MSNNNIATALGLKKGKDQTWSDSTGNWRVEKRYKGYIVYHIPTNKIQACTGINTLASAKSIMKEELLNNISYFR
ncbi:hypothetical protein GW796_07595 [archaeon]|nr:hypothetical protein [archaeon]